MSRNIKHNKRRNLGLVFEFLTREVSNSVVAGDRKKARMAVAIIEKHLSPGTTLFEELSLHRQVMETRGVSERLAKKVIDELKAAGIKFSSNGRNRESAKSAMIHEINKSFGQDLFDKYRINDYTAHASVNILMSRGIDSRIDEAVEAAKVEEHLTEFLMSVPGTPQKFDRDASLYAYKTAIGLFEQEFGKELTSDQSSLLKEYVRVSLGGNPAPFQRAFEKQRKELYEAFNAKKSDQIFRDDKEMATKLNEAIVELENLDSSKEESVEQLMLFHNIRKEIES